MGCIRMCCWLVENIYIICDLVNYYGPVFFPCAVLPYVILILRSTRKESGSRGAWLFHFLLLLVLLVFVVIFSTVRVRW